MQRYNLNFNSFDPLSTVVLIFIRTYVVKTNTTCKNVLIKKILTYFWIRNICYRFMTDKRKPLTYNLLHTDVILFSF